MAGHDGPWLNGAWLHGAWLHWAWLDWTIVFLVIAVVMALLGFSGLAQAAGGIARLLFAVFLVLFIVSWLQRAGYLHL